MTWSATKAPRGVPGNFDARTGISSDGPGDGFHMCFFNGLRMGYSMDWLKGQSTGNHRFSDEIWVVPVMCPL